MNRVDSLLAKPFSSLKQAEKLGVIRLGPYQPKESRITQQDGKKHRTFCVSWFERKPWLTFSDDKNALFCFYCLLFGGENLWTRTGCKDLKHLSERIRKHENSRTHINNAVQFAMFGQFSIPSSVDDDYHLNIDCTSEEDNSSTQEHQPGMSGPYLLKKETHCTTILDQLMRDDTFTDVTLTAEGQNIRAHRMVLCLASNYFRQVLSKDSHIQSVVVLRDVKFSELKSIINFIYTGEATVDASELESFMRTAETLEITSLCESCRSPGGLFSSVIGSSLSSAVEEAEKAKSGKRPLKDDFCRPSKSSRTSDGLYYSQVSVDDPHLTIVKEEIPENDEVEHTSDVGGKSHVPIEKGADPHGSITDGCVISGQDSSCNVTVVPLVALQGQIMGGCPPLKTDPGHPVSEVKRQHATESTQAVTSGNDVKHSNEDTGELPSIPGRCPYCPHLSQSFEGYPMMQHLLLTHPCKPAFPCNLCWRVFVKRTTFKQHREQCCTAE